MRYSSYWRLRGTRNIGKTKFTGRFSKPFSTCKQNIRCPNMDGATSSLSPMGGNYPYNITYPRGESFACLRRIVKQANARLHVHCQYGARETRVYHEQNDKIYRGRHNRGQTMSSENVKLKVSSHTQTVLIYSLHLPRKK